MKSRKTKGSHSFEGCKTCRRRHLKCDQTTPRCNRCRTSGLSCDFTPSLRWMVATGSAACFPKAEDESDAGQYSRRHLYSDDSRISMASSMLASISGDVAFALNEVEEGSKTCGNSSQNTPVFTVGPFGVFGKEPASSSAEATFRSSSFDAGSVPSPITTTSSSAPANADERPPKQPAGVGDHAESGPDEAQIPESLAGFFSESLDFLQWGDLFTWDSDVVGATAETCVAAGSSQTYHRIEVPSNSVIENDGVMNSFADDIVTITDVAETVLWPEVDLAVDAPLLLKHFNDEVINQMGSLPINEKSGWRILNFPSAILTLSQISMLGGRREDVRHANLANFYGLIAVSSYHLSLNPLNFPDTARPESHWASLSSRTYRAAKHHLHMSLGTESGSDVKLKAKYKEQLMATGAVLATALVSGNTPDSKTYLVEMERLIRHRGLTKAKLSRRARLFHNIYAWMRVVSESTHVLDEDDPAVVASSLRISTSSNSSKTSSTATAPDQQLAGTLEPNESCHHSVGSEPTLDSFLHLEPFPPSTAQPEYPEDTQDIHLVNSRQCQEDMHMQIYGVPETWLRLVSQITRLANVMDRLRPRQSGHDAETLARLQPRSSELEEAVCALSSRFRGLDTAETGAPGPHIHMTRALSSALVIFFYRRIRNLHPMLLQGNVDQVIESLGAFDQALEENGLLGPGTAWPAFIAGAEAAGPEQRRRLETWLERAHDKSGWRGYVVSREVLSDVWRQRDASTTGTTPTWIEVCRRTAQWPLLC
ncbi:Arginine metabolism regulation protein II [Colletotrichum trifolii]|uniref:Arginine metabolism regulation protein II n=1 Tax=Colletotrichum trifolii TaxID=5466 RepID=A0A4R8RMC5_COLTR|nr:Arginine metabolism regulation protein II [Colletotrichum trifolii]